MVLCILHWTMPAKCVTLVLVADFYVNYVLFSAYDHRTDDLSTLFVSGGA